MTTLPQGMRSYKRTPTFTEDTVPAGLLRDHSTKEGTWGLIRVEEGRLPYFVTEAQQRGPVSSASQTRYPLFRASTLAADTKLGIFITSG